MLALTGNMIARALLPALVAAFPHLINPGAVRAQDTTTIVLVATTDVHGRVMDWDYERNQPAPLGLVRAATVVDSLRREHPGRVVLVDAGDLIQGNPFATYFARVEPRRPHPILEAMNRMGYDAATPGNHEFNFGVPFLRSALSDARFPYVSSNILELPSGRPLLPPFTLVTRAGVRIGITGATTPGVMVWDGPNVRGRVSLTGVSDAVPAAVEAMRRAGAEVTVLLGHAGLSGPSSYDTSRAPPENDLATAITRSRGLDVVVMGHTHRELADTTIGEALVVQPRNWVQSVAVVTLKLARSGRAWRIAERRGQIVPLATTRADPALVAAVLPAHEAARSWATQPVGRSAEAMPATRARLEDTPVIDFINAVQRAASGAQLSLAAAFNPRGGIPAGPVSWGDLASIYPYDNQLRAVRVSGSDLREILEYSSRYYRGMGPGGPIVNDSVPGYNFDILSGAEYELDLTQPVGRRVTFLRIAGREVAAADSFTLAVNNYRQQGGGGYPVFSRAPVVWASDEYIRDMLAAEIARRGTIRPEDYFERNWAIRRLGGRASGVREARDHILLRVLATNDLHGRLEARPEAWSNRRPVGGVAFIAGMMRRLERECACPALRVDAGDMMQGTSISNLTFGRATIETMNAMGYAAATVGNHEFDWSTDTLAARSREMRFALVAANIRDLRTRRPPPWVVPWRMVSAGGLRVAVVGYATPGTTSMTSPEAIRGLGFRGPQAADEAIAAARRERPDFVILLAHAGAFCDSLACNGEVVELARALRERPDLIVSGHTHSLVSTVVNGIPIVQARSGGTSLGVVDVVNSDTGRAVRIRVETVWADREDPDTAVVRIVERHAAQIAGQVGRTVAVLAEPLLRDSGAITLGDMVADAIRRTAGSQLALVNATGVRRSLPAGPLAWGTALEVLPFNNRVVRLEVSGAVLRRALEHGLARGEAALRVSGLRVRADPSRPAGSRLVSVTLEDGSPLLDSATYTMGTLDYLSGGGSGYTMLRGLPAVNTGVLDLDSFISYLQRLPQPIRAPSGPARIETER